MLRLSLNQARPGMELALPIAHPHRIETVLLRAGAKLDALNIPRLRELGVHEAWIRYPGLEDLMRFANPLVLAGCRELTATAASALDAAMVDAKVELSYAQYKRVVMGLLERLIEAPASAVLIGDMLGAGRPLVRHAGSTCILSLLMGLKLEFYLVRERSRLTATNARDISGLGVGALFADLGTTRLDEETLAAWNERHDESDPAWQRHVTLGFELVKDAFEPSASAVVLHHHQRYDGTGFPQRMDTRGQRHIVAGSDIHLFARIAGAADLYQRLRYPAHAPGSSDAATPPIPAVRALGMLRKRPYSAWIDPVVLRALFAVVPAYAPGTLVTLCDGREGVVVDWSGDEPCRPVLEIIDPLAFEPLRGDPKRERVDLRVQRHLWIRQAEGHEVAADNFEPAYPGELDLARVARSIGNRAEEIASGFARDERLARAWTKRTG